MNKFER